MEDDDLFWRCYLKDIINQKYKGTSHKVIQFDGASLTLKYHQVLH